MVCSFNTWIMSINPSGINGFEWDDLRETIHANVEDSVEADKLYDAIDWLKTDTGDGDAIVTKKVYDWMVGLKVFALINRSIPGFKIEYDGYYRHGLAGLHINLKATYKTKRDVVNAIKRLPKAKFDEYMEKNHSNGSGFHSFIPNSRDGLLEQNDICYMMACYLGYRVSETVKDMKFDNCFCDDIARFDHVVACPDVLDFTSSREAYELIKFKDGTND